MTHSSIVMRETRYHQIKAVLARLRLDSSARLVVLVDKDGQQIAVHGELGDLDTTSLASLAAGNVAATGGMAKLIGEKEFPTLSHEGEKESIHISVIGRVLLVVVFDDRSSLGLVKLRSKQISHELATTFAEIERESAAAGVSLPRPTRVRFQQRSSPAHERSVLNYASREINCKIVYYGPGLCGKTTNLQFIYDSTAAQAKGKLISLATETDRTLFFDFMPLELGTVRGFKTRFHLYTVPGQVFYEASRKLILKGVDGVVFVADSQEERMDANIESLYNLEENLRVYSYDLMKLPYVLQLNKRDLPTAIPSTDLAAELLRKDEPVVEAVAATGVGVFDTLKAIAKQVLTELRKS